MKKLKLSKASWISLSAGIFVVALISLGLTRSHQLQEQSQLDQDLILVETRLGKLQVDGLSQQRDELQEKLDASTILLEEARDKLIQPVESIDVIDEFYAIAYACDVEVASISSSGIKSSELEAVSCSTITLSATVEGELPDLIALVIKLNHDFTTGIVKSAQISISEEAEAAEGEEGEEVEEVEEEASVASIQMTVYAYEGG